MSNTKQALGFWKTAFVFGFPVGLLIICSMLASFVAFGLRSDAGSAVVGFALMLFYMSLIFFGIRRFRNVEQGGVIKFAKAFGLGLAMALFSGLAYVLVWEIYVAFTGDSFIAEYTDHLIALEKAKNVSAGDLAKFIEKAEVKEAKYANPIYRMPVTFIENFSMGLIVALVSALSLHNPKFWARK